MPTVAMGSITADTLWPTAVAQDLTLEATLGRGFLLDAAQQLGVSAANDFIDGNMHRFYRQRLLGVYGAIPNAVPLAELPDYTAEAPEDITPGLQNQFGAPPFRANVVNLLRLDAPLSVQATARPGFFPFNKFSSVPLGITGARTAVTESPNSDAFKRLMIVPNCHVKRLTTGTYTLATGVTVQEIVGIDTSNGFIDLSVPVAGNSNRRPMAVLDAGAIESARIALLSVAGAPNGNQIGANFMVHLRRNVSFTV